MKPNLYIRADGNPEIGLGHLVRCIAFAQMLKKCFNIKFICKQIPDKIVDDLRLNDLDYLIIDNEEQFLNLVNKNEVVVIDSYNIDSDYQKKIKDKDAVLICIDDLHDKFFFADLIINHAPGVSDKNYYSESYTQFALGPEYVLLRSAFLEKAKTKRTTLSKGKVALICFGGLDIKNLSLAVLNVVICYKEFERIIFITGTSYPFFDTVASIIENDKRIIHYHAIGEAEMVELIGNASLAIVPSSGILLETLAVGNVVISGMYAENQRILYNRYKDSNAFIDAGDFSDANITRALQQFFTPKSARKNIFDGLSNTRILNKVFNVTASLRKASVNDCQLLFNWVNDEVVRLNAINKQNIIWEDHQKWFKSMFSSEKTCQFFILELLGCPVGQIRYEKKEEFWVMDYSLDKDHRGMGLGKFMVRQSLNYFLGEKIRAYVLSNNNPSRSVFMSLGFSQGKNETINKTLCNVYDLYL